VVSVRTVASHTGARCVTIRLVVVVNWPVRLFSQSMATARTYVVWVGVCVYIYVSGLCACVVFISVLVVYGYRFSCACVDGWDEGIPT
jgi:hypothetical protein